MDTRKADVEKQVLSNQLLDVIDLSDAEMEEIVGAGDFDNFDDDDEHERRRRNTAVAIAISCSCFSCFGGGFSCFGGGCFGGGFGGGFGGFGGGCFGF